MLLNEGGTQFCDGLHCATPPHACLRIFPDSDLAEHRERTLLRLLQCQKAAWSDHDQALALLKAIGTHVRAPTARINAQTEPGKCSVPINALMTFAVRVIRQIRYVV
jgi:hypothetical protein